MKFKFLLYLLILLALVLIFAGCVAGPNPAQGTADSQGHLAGFWLGLWHGLILPVSLIISLFNKTVHIYEVHNIGLWYNVGYMLGI
jgi:hypothetical protein